MPAGGHSTGGGSNAGIPLQAFSERFRGPNLVEEIQEGQEIGEGEETRFGGVKGGEAAEALPRGHGELSPDARQVQNLHSLGGWARKRRQLDLSPRPDMSRKKNV